MNLEEARVTLSECRRQSLGDRETGAFEIFWSKDEQEVGGGWFESDPDKCTVWFTGTNATFAGNEALALRYCGASSRTEYMQPSEE